MRSYIIGPPFEMSGHNDERTTAAINLISDVVFDSLRCGGDSFQHAVVWADPGDEPGGTFHEDIAEPHVLELKSDEALRGWLRKSVDPNDVGGGDVRSIATCRCVTFGYDGQAFLCLRHEDEPPISPDLELAVVEERPELLVNTDYFDGWARN